MKMWSFGVSRRNSGSRWRSAVATTSSEGGIPGRTVRGRIRRSPDEPGMCNGEVMQQSLADETGLDEDVIGMQLAFDVVAVFG